MSTVKFFIDIGAPLAEMQRLSKPPQAVIAELEHALAKTFEQTQEDVHVITGSLRGSGKTESDFQDSVWSGEISYGGASPGFPKDPVVYAGYERARGDDHDFLRNTHLADSIMQQIIDDYLAGA